MTTHREFRVSAAAGGWVVREGGEERITCRSKDAATRWVMRELRGVASGRMVVEFADGTIQYDRTYGALRWKTGQPPRERRERQEPRHRSRFRDWLAEQLGSPERRAEVCWSLASRSPATRAVWSPEGPLAEAAGLAVRRHDPLPGRERALLGVCWALWRGMTNLRLTELAALGAEDLVVVGELVAALARGPEALEGWLGAYRPAADGGAPKRRARGA